MSIRPPIPARARIVDRPHPTETAGNRLAHVQLENALVMAARTHARGRLIDIGCGHKPYEGLFAPYVDEHFGVDHADSVHASTAIDLVAGAYDIPLPDASFDTALLSEVLEHLEEPAVALREAHRLVRPGGAIILTTPMAWVLHEEPRDFFRYTPHGLRHLLGEAGFTDVDVTPLSGQWTTVTLLASYAIRRSPAKKAGRLLERAIAGANWAAVRLDERSFQPWLSWNHLAVARRP